MSQPDRTSLPIRRETFAGVADRTLDGSQPDWNLIGHPTPPEGAPNVLLVLIDDAGFGNPSTFGGPIQTPNYTRIAEGGLRYNRFHVTALCSPTRAALLTGRNNHAVGFGSIGEFAGGFPGYSAILPRDCAPLPRILRDNGYSTAAFGKWHLTPDGQQGPAGPFDRWPNGWGFDYFYGILGGGSSQWDPVPGREPEDHRHRPAVLRRGRSVLLPGRDGRPARSSGCTACARRTRTSRSSSTSRPAAATRRTTSRRSGPTSTRGSSTRAGTSSARRRSPARRSSASSPPTPSSRRANEAFPAWDDVPDKLKPFYARQMEVYAGYSENADHNVGRVIDAIDELGELDNTLILWIWGDNGASMEGTITGSFNELTMQNGIPLTDEMQLQLAERYGGIGCMGRRDHGPALRRGVGVGRATRRSSGASRSARTSAGPATRWSCTGPIASTTPAALRSQFTHVIDVGADDPRRRRDPRARRPSTGSNRSRCTARRSPRRSPMPARRSTAPSSTSRRSATAACTRTAGGSR